MDYNFELFEGVKGKFTPSVSISKPGAISFSAGAQRKFGLIEYDAAQLFFDKGKNTIAIKFLKGKEGAEERSVVNLKHRGDNKGCYIACKSFISAYELESTFGKKYSPKEIDHPTIGKLMLLELSSEELGNN